MTSLFQRLTKPSPLKYGLLLLWVISLVGGTLSLNYHASVPGAAASLGDVHPGVKLPRLLVFLHPHCPCSRATVGELERLIAAAPGRFETEVIFIDLGDRDQRSGSLWRQVETLPGTRVRADIGGEEALRLHARTSGQVFFYDGENRLKFAGGITPARGHWGDSAGRAAVLALLRERTPSSNAAVLSSQVFGCALQNSKRASERMSHVHAH